jgi:hypothetical protein
MSTDSMIALGNDQLVSQWDIGFPEGFPTGGNADDIALRCDMDFQIPEQIVGTYPIWKKGVKVDKTNMITGTDKKFSLVWRLDQNWNAFDAIQKWFTAVYDPITGTGLPDNMARATILCQAVDTMNAIKKVIRFKGSKPISISMSPFSNNGEDPMRVTVGFIYDDLIFENV